MYKMVTLWQFNYFGKVKGFFMKKMFVGSALLLAAVSIVVAVSNVQAAEGKKAKNLILMIGDGMGVNSDVAGTYYRFGEKQAQQYHKFRFLTSATFSLKAADFDEDTETGYDGDFFWGGLDKAHGINDRTGTTDSAASGTALNWGHKTHNGRIGSDFDGKRVELLGDLAEKAGKSVGAVSSVQIANATPAAVKAHQFTRSLLKEISREQILDQQGLTVLMGAGHPEFNNGEKVTDALDYSNVGGQVIWEALRADNGFAGVKFIEKKSDFDALAAATPDKAGRKLPKRLVGVVQAVEDMAPVDGYPDGDPKNANFLETVGPNVDAKIASIPTLSQMAVGALNILSANENGFYLMVEGGAIDHANHANNINLSVLEHTSFTKAVDSVIAWVETYSSWDETLLIITADHETGQLWGEGTYDDANNNNTPDEGETFNGYKNVKNNGKGNVPGAQYATNDHTNATVPFWIHGAGAECVDQFIRGKDPQAAKFYGADGYQYDGSYIYNSDVPKIFKAASCL